MIRDIVTRGFGNGTFAGTIPLVVTRGYTIGAAINLPLIITVTGSSRQPTITATTRMPNLTAAVRMPTITATEA